MPGPGRKVLGFLKGSLHRRSSKASKIDDTEDVGSEEDQILHEKEGNEQDYTSEVDPDVMIKANDSQDGTYLNPEDDSVFDPSRSGHSEIRSLSTKPTTATLGETFSSGGFQDVIDYVESREESVEVQNSELYYSQGPDYEFEEQGIMHNSNEYTEFVNGTQEEDNDTLDYTANDEHSDTLDAHHQRLQEYHSLVGGMENSYHWEETSVGFETCSRTLNTNLEGIHFVPDSSVVHPHSSHSLGLAASSAHNSRMTATAAPSTHTHLSATSAYSRHSDHLGQMMEQSQYYYEGEDYDQYQESYGTEGYYYDDEGQLLNKPSYPEGDGRFIDENNTIANSTIATDGNETFMEQQIIATDLLPSHFQDDDAPIDSYESEESSSSWDDEETRDMSLLDEEGDTVAGDEEPGIDDDEEEEDEDSESDSGSESDSDSEKGSPCRRRRRPRPRPKSMMELIDELKHCSLKGSSVSYDEDEDDDDNVPDVAQISTGATSMTSISFESGKGTGRKKKKKSRRNQLDRNLDNLFDKVSALGQELLGAEEDIPKRRGKRSLRRRERDPAARIVDSLRDIFNCGHPKHY